MGIAKGIYQGNKVEQHIEHTFCEGPKAPRNQEQKSAQQVQVGKELEHPNQPTAIVRDKQHTYDSQQIHGDEESHTLPNRPHQNAA